MPNITKEQRLIEITNKQDFYERKKYSRMFRVDVMLVTPFPNYELKTRVKDDVSMIQGSTAILRKRIADKSATGVEEWEEIGSVTYPSSSLYSFLEVVTPMVQKVAPEVAQYIASKQPSELHLVCVEIARSFFENEEICAFMLKYAKCDDMEDVREPVYGLSVCKYNPEFNLEETDTSKFKNFAECILEHDK